MGKTAFLFAGQGAQYPGMGRSLSEHSEAASAVFAAADAVRPGTSEQCFHGSAQELACTANTQPCVFCVDLAAARALEEAGIHADAVAGFSLGEVAALSFAGVFAEEDGFSFVCRRAQAMDRAARSNPSGMAAVLKLENETVEQLCREFEQVYPVNYNCPGQLTIAAQRSQLAAFCKRVQEAGGRAVELAVSGGFHSPFMNPAAQELAKELEHCQIQPCRISVYANRTALPYPSRLEEVRQLIAQQVNHPVRWEQTIRQMIEDGFTTMIEVGPGKTLSGLVKKISRTVRVFHVEDIQGVQEVRTAQEEE